MFNFSIEHFWKLKKGHQHLLLQSFRENIKENGTKSLVIYGIIYSTLERESGSNPPFQMLERERKRERGFKNLYTLFIERQFII